jgi:hypothetical protein
MNITKEESKRQPLQLVNSEIDGDRIVCNLRAFLGEKGIDEKGKLAFGDTDMAMEVAYKYEYQTIDFKYSIPVVQDRRAYLKENEVAILAYAQAQADNPLATKLPQDDLAELDKAKTVPELAAVMKKMLNKLL